jgi:hypothetical protein
MIDRNILAAVLAAVAALAAPLGASAQVAAPPAPMPSYAHAFLRDPFPYAKPVAVAQVRHTHHRRYAYPYPAYSYAPYGYVGYGYPVYPYPVYGYNGYGYPGWYGPAFSVGIGFRFGGCCFARFGGRRR